MDPAWKPPEGSAADNPISEKLIGSKKKAKKNWLAGVNDFFYLTDRILMAPFPEEDVIGKMSDFLNKVHENTYLVYNLSEHKYDYSFFNNSVSSLAFLNSD